MTSTSIKRMFIPLFVASVFFGLALFMFFALAPSARAVDCNVPSGSYGTIQSAINDNACDTIIVAAGTYTENLSITRNVTINGTGSSTIIDGNDTSRVITIDGSGIVVYLNYLRVTNGDATTGPAVGDRNGGGIYVVNGATLHGSNLQVDNNLASSSTTGFGGGIAISQSSAYITDTLVYNNVATQRAGGLTGHGRGGGLYVNNNAYLSVSSSQIMSNTASYQAAVDEAAAGGGLFIQFDTQVYLNGNTWSYNVARGENSDACPLATCASGTDTEGGGAIGADMSSGTAVINIYGDTFSNNVANKVAATSANSGRGGAIAFNTSQTTAHITATLSHVTMYNNIAAQVAYGSGEEGNGGGIYARHTALEIDKSTILNNKAAASFSNGANGNGGGVYIREPEEDDYLKAYNSVVASNDAGGANGTGAQLYINYSSASQNAAQVIHSTIADDTQNSHVGLYFNGPTSGDSLWVGNTIIANHVVGINNVNTTGFARARYVLFYGNGQNQLSPGSTAFPGNDNTTFVSGNPMFVDAANGNYHIQSGSAAYNTGGNEAEIILPVDIDGETRPLFTEYDIGADELNYPVYLPMVIK